MTHVGVICATNQGLRVMNCSCGYAHLDPLPSDQDVAEYYRADQFYSEHSPRGWFAINQQEHQAGLWRNAYAYQNKLLKPGLWGDYPNVIDLGCGDGYWLDYYHRFYNHSSWGIEPSETARILSPISGRIAQDIDGLGYKRYSGINEPYNSVRMALVLEHVVDPIMTIAIAKKNYIGAKGKLLVIVPNEFNPLQERVQKHYGSAWYVQKPHINYFSKQSVRNLLEASGFRVTFQGGTFPMELLYLRGWHYIGNDAVGQKCHQYRLNFEKRLGMAAFSLYHLWYSKLGWGRESIIVGQSV
jgi:hypothetical protein